MPHGLRPGVDLELVARPLQNLFARIQMIDSLAAGQEICLSHPILASIMSSVVEQDRELPLPLLLLSARIGR